MTDQLLTRKQVLDMLSISDSSERRMRQYGEMPDHLRIGRKVYYRLSTVEQWLSNLESDKQ